VNWSTFGDLALGRSRGLFLIDRVDYRHALPIFHITSTYRADGVGLYGDARMEDCTVISGISGFDD